MTAVNFQISSLPSHAVKKSAGRLPSHAVKKSRTRRKHTRSRTMTPRVTSLHSTSLHRTLLDSLGVASHLSSPRHPSPAVTQSSQSDSLPPRPQSQPRSQKDSQAATQPVAQSQAAPRNFSPSHAVKNFPAASSRISSHAVKNLAPGHPSDLLESATTL